MNSNNGLPLSNKEVLFILTNSNKNKETNKIFNFLLNVDLEERYPFGLLRQLKSEGNLEASLEKLCMLSNTNETSIVSPEDLQKINEYLSKQK